MDAPSSSSSSTYTTTKSYRCICYDVFLSFRGADVRLDFNDHLYNALEDAGFITFRDNEGLPRGETIDPELYKAIHDSKCSVVVLSKDYGSSESCLFELMTILERTRNSDHIVIPIFYNIDPKLVWGEGEEGYYKKSFSKHEEKYKDEMSKVNQWRAALEEATKLQIKGMILAEEADKHEAKFTRNIVNEVKKRLRPIPLSPTPNEVGIYFELRIIESLLWDRSSGMLLICGVSGIGKTTIARSLYSSNYNAFAGCAFLENISDFSRQPNGLIRLQSKLLSILTKRKIKINNVDEGRKKIEQVVRFKRVMLVLDDVNHVDQLDALVGWRDLFYTGCKIIVTTRQNDQLLKAREAYIEYKVKPLYAYEAVKLFSQNAFGQDKPKEHYEELAERIVEHCEGNPLALKVLGRSALSWKSISDWETAIDKLKHIPNGEILEKIKLSYDALGDDDHDKDLFLDISCFFIGEDKDLMVTILDGCYYTKIGIRNLEERHLITIDGMSNTVRMHNLVRDMGRDIIRQESPEEPGNRSRLWEDMDSYNILINKTGEKTIEGLVLHRCNIPSVNSNQLVLETDAFAKMRKLRLLILSEVELSRSTHWLFPKRLRPFFSSSGYESFPKGLIWLSWRGFPLRSIPDDFLSESLVALDLRDSDLRRVWEVSKFLPVLKILDLSGSRYLTSTPDFSLIPKLERLILNDCVDLITVHESLGILKRLIILELRDCKNISYLPNISTLESLETLDITGCTNLSNFSLLEICKLSESLKVFRANGTPMNRCLNSIGDDTSLQVSLGPRRLVELSLANCKLSNDHFPREFSNLSSLQSLDLSDNPICWLPDFVKSLHGLDRLSLSRCENLQSVTGLPSIGIRLDLIECSSLKRLTFKSSSRRPDLIDHTSCRNMFEFENWFKLEPIESIDVEMICILRLCNLDFVKDVNINISSIAWDNTKRLPIQAIHEHGILNIFLPGNEIPSWFSHKSKYCSISIVLPRHPPKIWGLNISTIYTFHKKDEEFPDFSHMMIQVKNHTKGLKWMYLPSFFGFHLDDGEDMMWLSHWKSGDNLVGGDEVTVSIITASSDKIEFKECGMHVVYEQEEKMIINQLGNITDIRDVINNHWREANQISPGTYLLMGGPSSTIMRYARWDLYNDLYGKTDASLSNDEEGHMGSGLILSSEIPPPPGPPPAPYSPPPGPPVITEL